MGGWGTGSWGLSTWGFGGGSGLSIVSAYALTERSIVVTLTKAPLANNTIVVGDALNPKTWTITRQDTGEDLLVIASRKITDESFELYTLRKFAHALITHEVSSTTLVDPSGDLIDPPTSTTFAGCKKVVVTPAPTATLDLRNIPAGDSSVASGTLQVGTDGDYISSGGEEFLRKLIIRRLITQPGEFLYNPTYGVGLRDKEPLPTSDLPKLQAQIELQLQREPEIKNVATTLTLTSDNILTVQVQATLRKTNQQVVLSMPIQTQG